MNNIMYAIPWNELTSTELSLLRTYSQVCSKCGVCVGEKIMKYCGDGSDKNNSHHWQQPMETMAFQARTKLKQKSQSS
jgi:hypothetical protein